MLPLPTSKHSHKSIPTRRIRTLEEAGKHASAAKIFQAILDYRSSRNLSQPSTSAKVVSTAQVPPRDENDFSEQSTDQGPVTDIVDKEARMSPLLRNMSDEPGMRCNTKNARSRTSSDVTCAQFSPIQIANQFAEKAAGVLSTKQVENLIIFLQEPRQVSRETLRGIVQDRFHTFCQAEIAMTGEPRDRLAAPSGPEDAALGIILHCQSKEGHVGEFWDTESPTIQALIAKGLNSEFVYGFDWHWRAEESARRPGRANCPATHWTQAKRSLHDGFSSDILDILSLPWLIIGGSCAKNSYKRTLSSQSRLITVPLSPEIDLQFELEIRANRIKRIATYVPHPSSGFFHPSFASAYATILDAGISFFLWLQRKDDTPSFFTATKSAILRGIPGAAPFRELYQYRQREEVLGRKLTENEYQPPFLIWAAKYLSERPSAILSRGDSLANVVVKKIGQAISAKAANRQMTGYKPSPALSTSGRKGTASRYGYTFKRFWDGECVTVTKKGSFKIFLSEDQPNLELNGRKRLYDLVAQSSAPVTIHFLAEVIMLQQGGKVVFQQACTNIKDLGQRDRWTEQARIECTRS
ncbi:hypothetical protein ABEF93_007168 [Exophiala dermatitidis]